VLFRSPDVILAGLAPGLFSVAILTVNNLRDIDQDRAAGKKTLPVRFGQTFARIEYTVSLLAGCAAIPVGLCLRNGHWPALACLGVLPFALWTVWTVWTKTDGPALNDALAATGKWLLAFSVLFSVGWIL
jgi:1,4-dihydroxy-2-naphthoate octaprenyltransferase